MSHEQWQPTLAALATAYRVIAPDLRGMGKSPLLPGQTSLTLQDHLIDLLSLLDHLEIHEPIILAGLSMGGYIAWQWIKQFPARLRGLILCHTRVVADTPEQAQGRLQLAQRMLDAGSVEPVLQVMLPRLLHPQVNPQVIEQIRAMGHQATPAGLAANLNALATREDVSRLVAQVDIPTLVISGELDSISPPAEMESWASQMPKSRLIVIPGAGHVSPLETPDLFYQAILENAPW